MREQNSHKSGKLENIFNPGYSATVKSNEVRLMPTLGIPSNEVQKFRNGSEQKGKRIKESLAKPWLLKII